MTNAWNVTEAEYKEALELSRDGNTSRDDSAAYWQLVRFYRGQTFSRDEAAHAARLIRAWRRRADMLKPLSEDRSLGKVLDGVEGEHRAFLDQLR